MLVQLLPKFLPNAGWQLMIAIGTGNTRCGYHSAQPRRWFYEQCRGIQPCRLNGRRGAAGTTANNEHSRL